MYKQLTADFSFFFHDVIDLFIIVIYTLLLFNWYLTTYIISKYNVNTILIKFLILELVTASMAAQVQALVRAKFYILGCINYIKKSVMTKL